MQADGKDSTTRPAGSTRLAWRVVGLTATGAAIAGVVLPLVPTTPFLLLAAFAFARSSPRLLRWLVEHRHFGRLIADWQRDRSIALRAKLLAVIMMMATLGLSWWLDVPGTALLLQAIALGGAALFVLTRPNAR